MSVDLVKRLLEPFKAQFGIEDDDDEYIPSEEPAAPVEAPQAEVQEAAPAESPAEAPQAAKSGPIDQAQADALLASLLQAQAEESSAEAAQPASSDNAAPVEKHRHHRFNRCRKQLRHSRFHRRHPLRRRQHLLRRLSPREWLWAG